MDRLVTDPLVFEERFVPDDLRYRDAEREAVTTAFEPIRYGERPESVVLCGPPGSGKTCTVRSVIEQLQLEVDAFSATYLDCGVTSTRFEVLVEILSSVGVPTFDLHQGVTPYADILTRLEQRLGDRHIVILDEVDQLRDVQFLYSLQRISGLTLAVVTSQCDNLFAALDTRLESRLKAGFQIWFDQYSTEELAEILEHRATQGLVETAVTQRQLELIANAVDGDAAHGIRALRAAAWTAAERGAETIADEDLHEAVRETEAVVRETALDSLTPDQEMLYSLIRDADGITPSSLYEQYQALVENPKSQRTVRKYLARMVNDNLIRRTGETHERTYHAVPVAKGNEQDRSGIPEVPR